MSAADPAARRPGLDELFHLARGLPVAERRAALSRLVPDPALVDRVLRMLEHDAQAAARPAPLEDCGPFKLITRLGEGRHGEVFQAVRRGVAGEVALKVLKTRDPAALGRVELEANRARQVRSEAVVTVYGTGRTTHGDCWVEMGLCSEPDPDRPGAHRIGTTLEAVLDRVGPAQAVEMLEKLARGVHEAHHCGIVHGDVKPANVLVTPSLGRVMLADFGLASSLAAPGEQDGRPARVGTLAYMAPEQFVDRALPTPASDIHCLAATLFELVAKVPPYAARTPATVGDVPRAPFPRGLDRRLCEILERALDRDPARRPPSAADFADELRAWRLLEPTPRERRRPWRVATLAYLRNRRTIGLVALVATAGVLGVMATSQIFEAKNSRLEERARELNTRIGAAQAELDRLAAERDGLERQRDDLQKDSAAWDRGRRQLERVEREYHQVTGEKRGLEQLVAQLKDETAGVQRDLGGARERAAALEARTGDALAAAKEAEAARKESDARHAAAAKAAADGLAKQLEGLQTQLAEQQRVLGRIEEAGRTVEVRLERLERAGGKPAPAPEAGRGGQR